MKTVYLDNREFFPVLLEKMQAEPVMIVARGFSMRPFIENSRDKIVFDKATDIKVGDVILAEIHPGHYVCHRTEKVEGNKITMRGDGVCPNKRIGHPGIEVFTRDKVRAKVVRIIRKGKTYDTDTSRVWRIYSAIWTRLLPVRRPLLLAYRLLYMREVPNRLKNILKNKKQ